MSVQTYRGPVPPEPRRVLPAPPPPAGAEPGAPTSLAALCRSADWSLLFLGFLTYVSVIITFRLGIGALAIAASLAGLLFGLDRARFPAPVVLFALYLLWLAAGYTQTRYPGVVWEELVSLGKIGLIMLAAVNALRSRSNIRLYMIFFLVCFVTHPARGAIFNYLYGYSMQGRAVWNRIYANPNDLAALCLLALSMAAALFVGERGWVRRGALASMLILVTVILMTQSRGGFLALLVFGVLVLQGQRRKLRTLLLALCVGGVAAVFAPSGVWERVGGLRYAASTETLTQADEEQSANSRYNIWKVAFRMIEDQPFFGVGLGAYLDAHADYSRDHAMLVTVRGRRDTHSTYLNVLAEAGYPGLLFFLSILAATILPAERARRRAKQHAPVPASQLWYLEAGLFGFLTAGIFGTFGRLPFLYLHLALICALAATLAYERAAPARAARPGVADHLLRG